MHKQNGKLCKMWQSGKLSRLQLGADLVSMHFHCQNRKQVKIVRQKCIVDILSLSLCLSRSLSNLISSLSLQLQQAQTEYQITSKCICSYSSECVCSADCVYSTAHIYRCSSDCIYSCSSGCICIFSCSIESICSSDYICNCFISCSCICSCIFSYSSDCISISICSFSCIFLDLIYCYLIISKVSRKALAFGIFLQSLNAARRVLRLIKPQTGRDIDGKDTQDTQQQQFEIHLG